MPNWIANKLDVTGETSSVMEFIDRARGTDYLSQIKIGEKMDEVNDRSFDIPLDFKKFDPIPDNIAGDEIKNWLTEHWGCSGPHYPNPERAIWLDESSRLSQEQIDSVSGGRPDFGDLFAFSEPGTQIEMMRLLKKDPEAEIPSQTADWVITELSGGSRRKASLLFRTANTQPSSEFVVKVSEAAPDLIFSWTSALLDQSVAASIKLRGGEAIHLNNSVIASRVFPKSEWYI